MTKTVSKVCRFLDSHSFARNDTLGSKLNDKREFVGQFYVKRQPVEKIRKNSQIFIDFLMGIMYDKIANYGIPFCNGITFMKRGTYYGKA